MSNPDKTDTPEAEGNGEIISLKEFLEKVHPSAAKKISDMWVTVSISSSYRRKRINTPEIKLHCEVCEGERTFRAEDNLEFDISKKMGSGSLIYRCGDCQSFNKYYSLWVSFDEQPLGEVYKYGELPPFGVPLPNKVLRLFGRDADMFRKGRQCENLGYGVGAFAYYRRVVESHKNDIFDEIIKVCRTVNAPDAIINELQKAKAEISFSKAVETIKAALPQGLLINGHNPLLALHGALSVGLHDESDADCLTAAHAVRLVLIDLVEKMSILKQDNTQLNDAVQLLLKKKA